MFQNKISIALRGRYVIICKNTNLDNLEYQIGYIDESMKKIVWGNSKQYAQGRHPYIIVDQDNNFIGFHCGTQDSNDLFYQIGKVNLEKKSIAITESHKYFQGYVPWMVIDEDGNTVTGSRMPQNCNEWYYRGKLDKQRGRINFHKLYRYSEECKISKVNGNGVIVDISSCDDDLYYRVGKIGTEEETLEFGKNINYGQGISSYIQMDDEENVVEVHNDKTNYKLYYMVGKIDDEKKEIQWGNTEESGTGVYPCICFDGGGTIVEVHPSEKKEDIWYRVGTINFENKEIKFNKGVKSKYKGDFPYITFLDEGKIFMMYMKENDCFFQIGEIDEKKEKIKWW